MSRFLGKTAREITPYTPGEQPHDKQYIKLNTNESPYPPSPRVIEIIESRANTDLRLYPDPESKKLRQAMAGLYNLELSQVFAGGGSDEVLAYIFMAFFDKGDKVYFPDTTYGFYKVYADLFGLDITEIPLKDDFTIDINDYFGLGGHIFIANPNAPTGICLTIEQVEKIIKENPNQLVVIDEAYIDFEGENSSIPLIQKYDNLIVVQTFSKSRALAGMRLGFGFGNAELMQGLETIKYSFNPYNIDRISMDVGIEAIKDTAYFNETVAKIVATREKTVKELEKRDFTVLPSKANFVFAKHNLISGMELSKKLRDKGILIRYFGKKKIEDYMRITIGSDSEMKKFITALDEILN